MKLNSQIVMRPDCVWISLALILILLPSLVIPIYWYHQTKKIKDDVKMYIHYVSVELQSQVENTAKMLQPFTSMANNMATFLTSSTFHGVEVSFPRIQSRVAPMLFQAISIVPYLSQISYIGLDGLFFSYYIDKYNQTLAVYSNTSFPSNGTLNYTWYTQSVNRDNGKLIGEANNTNPMLKFNETLVRKALNSTNGGYVSLGVGWKNDSELLFLNTESVNGGKGVVSLGFSVKDLISPFSSIKLRYGNLYLATKDGVLLVEGIPNTQMVVVDDLVSMQFLKPNGQVMGHIRNVSCKSPRDGESLNSTILNIGNGKYIFSCSQIEILGLPSVYVLALPYKGLVSFVHKNNNIALMDLILMMTTMVITIVTFLFVRVRAARREMHLCAALIKSQEATQQAERKHLNKSVASAKANHDVRAYLAGITGLIDICYSEVPGGSEVDTNLRQMEKFVTELLGLLNSILDTSKLESEKLELKEGEFNLVEFLEEVVDFYHPVGMKKGVDVVLDPVDGSVMKFSHVKGDRVKLNQILTNLLSNASKFTKEGHISVRAWAKKPSLEKSIIASQRHGLFNHLSCLFFKNNEAMKAMKTIQADPNCMEFVFEVDDIGTGVPKENQNSIFEDYAQVKENVVEGGTGLGLGIVQSLVRLMGGEIGIVDKAHGERGTCFRFNAFLTTCETSISNDPQTDLEAGGVGDSTPTANSHQQNIVLMSIRSSSIKVDGSSHVILLIQSDERRKIALKFMETLGIRVTVVNQWEKLARSLKEIKPKSNPSNKQSSSSKLDWSSRSERGGFSKSASHNSSPICGTQLSAIDGSHHTRKHINNYNRRTRSSSNALPSFILLVIDVSSSPFSQLSKVVSEFRKELQYTVCKVVWLDNPISRSIPVKLDGDCSNTSIGIDDDDDVICKPFHGSRLFRTIQCLPEFGGIQTKARREYVAAGAISSSTTQTGQQRQQISTKSRLLPPHPSTTTSSLVGEIEEDHGGNNTSGAKKKGAKKQGLKGKKMLVAEDNVPLRKVAITHLIKLGATVEFCENGQESFEMVRKGLQEHMILPYDCIFMDCEMPIMDGFEATRMIRNEEKKYGVHIPIIALTAHTECDQQAEKMFNAGMDYILTKPLKQATLLTTLPTILGKF